MELELVHHRDKAAAEAHPKRDAAGAWYWNPVDAHAAFARRLSALTPAEASQPACFTPFASSAESQGRALPCAAMSAPPAPAPIAARW